MPNYSYKGYEIVDRDEWGNPIVLCPKCGNKFKEDGVKKHLLRCTQILTLCAYRNCTVRFAYLPNGSKKFCSVECLNKHAIDNNAHKNMRLTQKAP